MYINTNTLEYPLTAAQIIAANPLCSFPVPFELPDGYAEVTENARPAYEAATHKLVEGVQETMPGVYDQTWTVVALSSEELAANAAAAADALAQAKVAKNNQINAWRLAANQLTFPHGGKVFDCDALSRSDIEGTQGQVTNLDAMPPGWPGGWKAKDNTYLAITTIAQWKDFYSAMYTQGLVNFVRAQELKTALEAATTLAEVSVITW